MNIILISLKRAKDRRNEMIEQFNKLKLDPIIFDCFDTNDVKNPSFGAKFSLAGGYREGEYMKGGELACGLSHIMAINIAKSLNWEYVIILEDDIIISGQFKDKIDNLIKMLPNYWEHVYLTGIPRFYTNWYKTNITQLLPVTSQLVSRVDTTAAYIVKKTAYDKIIKKLSSLETTPDDLITHMILKENNLKSFLYLPFPIYIKNESSYIWNVKNLKDHQSKYFYSE